MKSVKKTKEGFTRFFATAFMNVISSLSPEKKAMIHSYGFGSFLLFSKCFVPNKFAKWVAHSVDCKSGDIIRNGKVISLSEQSIHHVLGIPMGTRPFPSDSSVGKDVVLSKFGKEKIPPVSFFADKLIKKEDLSDEGMFICFMIVVLSSFLCPNINLVPKPKYFGIFEDISRIKEFNWCGYVLQWLLDHIKAFSRGQNDKLKPCQGLGGCLYYLAVSFLVNCNFVFLIVVFLEHKLSFLLSFLVLPYWQVLIYFLYFCFSKVVYLDHIDFGHRKLPDSIPRISMWKEDMVKFCSSLDLKSPGVYGYKPLLDFQNTCYFKVCFP